MTQYLFSFTMSYDQLFSTLHTNMMEQAFLVNNPVLEVARQPGIDVTMIAAAILQYVHLPEEIVGFLQTAASHFPINHQLFKELERNWQQEQGSETGSVPHVEILKHLLKQDLAIDTSNIQSSPATKAFFATIEEGMKQYPWFAIGQAYALEATAVPELAILVGPVLNTYATLIKRSPPVDLTALRRGPTDRLLHPKNQQEAFQMTMNDWLRLHVLDFEVGHRDLLRVAIQESTPSLEEQRLFVAGFNQVLQAMNDWWKGLSQGG